MIKILFLRLAPWMGGVYPHPQDAPYAFDIAQTCAFLDKDIYEVIFFDGVVEKFTLNSLLEKIISIRPDILALTTTSSARYFAFDIFKRVRTSMPEVYIIGFGQHAHYSPHDFLSRSFQIDACIYGESELTLRELIQKTPKTFEEKKKVKGIYFWDTLLQKTPERDLTINLDQWPMPRYEIFKGKNYRIVSINFPTFRNVKPGWILASRGCPYQCTICSPAIRRSFGTRLRKHSPQRVADTFELLEKEFGINTIYFGDDTFSLDMEWAEKVCDELIKKRNSIQWGVATRVDRLSENLIKKMKDAGLRSVAIGVESGSDRILQDINKKITREQIEWAMAEFDKNKISVNATVIVGHVDETIDELNQTFSFLKKIKPIFIQLHYLSPYPGTKVAQVFKKRLKIMTDISHFNAPPMNVSKIPDEILQRSIQKIYLDYYTSWYFFKKYIKQRLPYAVTNPIKELKLTKETLAYFMLNRKRKTTST